MFAPASKGAAVPNHAREPTAASGLRARAVPSGR